MTIYAFICTRSKTLTETSKRLSAYLSRANISTKFLVNQKSIFDGYSEAFKRFDVQDNDIVILCHDDIEILTDTTELKDILLTHCLKYDSGFAGVAGTTYLSEDAIWWNQEVWKQGKHKGFVYHGKDKFNCESTFYGSCGRVVILDGLFLAASGKALKTIGLNKPSYLYGGWDYYDIHYTITAHKKGLKNQVVPIQLIHNSMGELAGRDSWHKNREAFINQHQLPISVG